MARQRSEVLPEGGPVYVVKHDSLTLAGKRYERGEPVPVEAMGRATPEAGWGTYYRQVDASSLLKCPECGARRADEAALARHLREAHGPQPEAVLKVPKEPTQAEAELAAAVAERQAAVKAFDQVYVAFLRYQRTAEPWQVGTSMQWRELDNALDQAQARITRAEVAQREAQRAVFYEREGYAPAMGVFAAQPYKRLGR